MTGLAVFYGAGFFPSSTDYNPGSGTISIPIGATTMKLFLQGAGAGGDYNPGGSAGSSGGGGGGYGVSTYTVTGHPGQTINYTVAAGAVAGASALNSTVTSGTFSLTTMTATGGFSNGGGGGGGPSTGGNVSNAPGGAGVHVTGLTNGAGGNAGSATPGTAGTFPGGGHTGANLALPTPTGFNGLLTVEFS